MPEADALRHPTPNHGVSYSFVFGLMGIRRITEMKLLCQTVCKRIRVTAFLTGESADFREVWRRAKFRESLNPSHCWPDWQNQGCLVSREWWVGPWPSPAWLPSVRERGSWDSLSLSHLCSVVVSCFSTVYVTSFTSSFSVSISCWMGSCSFPQRESWQSTCPSPCLILLLTSPPTTLFSHFLACTGMEISGLLSSTFLICTWTSNFQLPFTTNGYFFVHFLLTSQI